MGRIVAGDISDAGKGAVSTATLDITGHIVGTGSSAILLVWVAFNNNGLETVSTVAWDPTGVNEALTFLSGVEQSNDSRLELWYLKNPTPGTLTARITLDGALASTEGLNGIAQTYFGVDLSASTFNSVATDSSAVAPPQPSITFDSTPDELPLACCSVEGDDVTNISVDAPGVLILERNDGSGGTEQVGSLATKTSGATSTTINWTLVTGNDWVTIGVALRAAPKAILHPSHGFLGPPYI